VYYTVYQLTNTVNQKIYIGVHQTDDLDDGYYGSGLIIRRAIRKYGRPAFKKDILHIFNTRSEMYAKEAEIVTPEFLARPDVYNVTLGGNGGWHRANQLLTAEDRKKLARKAADRRRELQASDPDYAAHSRALSSERFKKMHATGTRRYDLFAGKTHSEETKARMREAHVGKHDGALNSQYGTTWMFSPSENRAKKVRGDEVESHLGNGWRRGRK
jgi:hypothetical protein